MDSFYLFAWDRLSALFAFDTPFYADEVGATTALDDDGAEVDVGSDTLFFPCPGTLPMGWSWSLWFCHGVLCNVMLRAPILFGLPEDVALGQFLLDGKPAPLLGPGLPVFAPYVDNGNVIGFDVEDTT